MKRERWSALASWRIVREGRDATHHFRNRIQEHLVVERFAEIRRDAGRQAAGTGLRLVVGGDDDRGKPHVGSGESSLNLETGQSGHLEIQDEAVRVAIPQRVEELLPRPVDDRVQVRRHEQPTQRLSDRFLVIDDGNERSGSGNIAAHGY
jgi:hypothetical protein